MRPWRNSPWGRPRQYTFMTLAALVLGSCERVIINGYPPPNQPPGRSAVELPHQVLTVGRALTISKAENLFWDDDTLTLTATSSDTTVVTVSLALEEGSYSLTIHPRSPGVASVAIVATEPDGDGSDDDQQPRGRSVTRRVGVTVVEA